MKTLLSGFINHCSSPTRSRFGNLHPAKSPFVNFGKYFFTAFAVLSLYMLVGCTSETEGNKFTGRWDLTITDGSLQYPVWFEVVQETANYSGSYVAREGSARPFTKVTINDDTLSFSLPPQYEGQEVDVEYKAWFNNGKLEGYTYNSSGEQIQFTGVPAPELPYINTIEWDKPVSLIQDNNLENWVLRFPDSVSGWTYENGILANTPPSEDLISKEKFKDFVLHAEYRTTENSNSGIYLRGRYELQVMNNPEELTKTSVGGVYGYIQPAMKAAKNPGEWNSFDVKLVGRYITIVLNGDTTAYMQEIPGITGGALDSNEGEPGPIMLQGDHREIEYRNIIVTPAK